MRLVLWDGHEVECSVDVAVGFRAGARYSGYFQKFQISIGWRRLTPRTALIDSDADVAHVNFHQLGVRLFGAVVLVIVRRIFRLSFQSRWYFDGYAAGFIVRTCILQKYTIIFRSKSKNQSSESQNSKIYSSERQNSEIHSAPLQWWQPSFRRLSETLYPDN